MSVHSPFDSGLRRVVNARELLCQLGPTDDFPSFSGLFVAEGSVEKRAELSMVISRDFFIFEDGEQFFMFLAKSREDAGFTYALEDESEFQLILVNHVASLQIVVEPVNLTVLGYVLERPVFLL